MVASSLRIGSHLHARCCISLATMGPELCLPMWPASRMFPVAKRTPSLIIRCSRRVCSCLPISSTNVKTSQIARSLYDCPEDIVNLVT